MSTTYRAIAQNTQHVETRSNPVTRYGLAALRFGLAFGLGAAGLQKLGGAHQMVHMFASIGVGQWLRYAVGTMELLGSIGLLIPRLAGLAACALAALLVGATITNLGVLHTSPALPLIFLAAAITIAWTRRADVVTMTRAVRR